MIKVFFYIILFIHFEILISEEFVNFNGDDFIDDYNPELLTRGLSPIFEYANLNIDLKQNIYVNLNTGNLIYKRLDYYLFDIGFPIIIEFTYNSGSTFNGRYGNQWQFNYNIRYVENNYNDNIILIENDDKSIVFEENNKKYQSFYPAYSLQKSENIITIDNFRNNYFTDNDFIRYNFSSNFHNYVSLIEDRNTNKIIFIYNADKQLVSIKFPSGRSLNLFYNDNLLTKIAIPNFGEIRYYYDNDNLVKVEYPNTEVINYSYNSNCNFLRKIISNLDTFSIEYDKNYLVDKFYKNSSDYVYKLQYDFINYSNKLIDKFDKEFIVEYDSLYRVREVYKYGILNKQILWDSLNRIIEYTNPLGEKYKYQYSEEGILVNYQNPDNKNIDYILDDKYKSIKQISINNSIINYNLDKNSNILSLFKNDEKIKSFDYDNFGQLQRLNLLNNKYEFLYDGLGKFKRLIINNDLEFGFEYNNNNDLTNVTEIGLFNISSNYDYSSNKIEIQNKYDHKYKDIYFSQAGLIDSIKFSNQSIYKYFYDNSNRLIKYRYDLPYDVNFSYLGDTSIIVNSPNMSLKIKYNYIEKIKSIINSNLYEYYYDSKDRLTEEKINDKLLLTYNYNSDSHLKKILFPNQSSISIEYDNFNRIVNISKTAGKRMTYTWDSYNRLINYKENDRNYSFLYNENGYLTQIPSGKSIIFKFDDRSNEINYLDYIYRINYDRYGRIESNSRNNKILTKYEYDDNLLFKIIYNNKNEIQFSFNNLNLLDEILQNGASISKLSYDKYNRIINFSTNLINSKINYDNFNRINSIISKNGKLINLDYSPDFLTINTNDKDFKYEYIEYHLQTVTNPNADKIIINYENSFLPNRISAPQGTSIGFEYNGLNRIKAIADSYGNKSIFMFNDYEKLITIFNKNSFSRTFKHNEDNNIIEYIDFGGTKYNIFYNDYLKKSKILSDYGDSVIYNYDRNLFLSSFKSFNGSLIHFDYDDYGQLLRLNDTYDTINYQYSVDDKLLKTNFNNQYIVDYKYGKSNQLENIIFNDSIKFDLTFDESNKLNRIDFNDNLILSINRDINGNIKFDEIWRSNPTNYNYNEFNQIMEKRSLYQQRYNYDKLGRLIQTTSINDKKETINYDLNSRIISKVDFLNNAYTYNYDKLNNVILMTRNVLDSIKYSYNEKKQLISTFLNSNNILNINYDKNRIISINSNITNINFKWFGNNYKSLLISNKYFVDTVKFDETFRTGNNILHYNYGNLGLINLSDSLKVNYDNLLRKIEDESIGLGKLKYKSKELFPFTVNFVDKTFNLNYKFPLKGIVITNSVDSIVISNNIYDNITNLKKNQIQVFEFTQSGFDNFTYSFEKLNQINRVSQTYVDYGFSNNQLSFDYYFNKNLKSIKNKNVNLSSFVYDGNANLILFDDAEGNLVQYSYTIQLINEIDYSNGKFIRYKYDDIDNIKESISNSELQDSTSFSLVNNVFESKSIKYFGDQFRIFFEKDIYKFLNKNKTLNLFNFLIDSTKTSIKLGGKEHHFELQQSFYCDDFKIDYDHLNQFLHINGQNYNIIDEVNIFGNLDNTKINSDTVILNNYDELNRLTYSSVSNIINSLEYNQLNKVEKLVVGSDTSNYQYFDNNTFTIDNKLFLLNSNKSVSKIISDNDTVLLFYDFADRLSNYISKDKNIKLLYNSMGELSSIIDKDTSFFFNFQFDSLNAKIVLNNNNNIFELYLKKDGDYKFPIIKFDLIKNKIEYLIRNSSGHPILFIDTNRNLIKIDSIDIFGYPLPILSKFQYFYKDFIYFDKLGLFFDNSNIMDPVNKIKINHNTQNYLNELLTLDPVDIFKVNPILNIMEKEFGINQNDLISHLDPLENEFTNVINRNKKEFIIDEINSIFNNFNVFNLEIENKEEKGLDIYQIGDVRNYIPNIQEIIADYESEIYFLPSLPIELRDSILLNSLKNNEILNPIVPYEKRDKIKQIKQLLQLAEVDTNFVLFSKLNDLQNIYEYPQIIYPDNVINLKLLNPDIKDINKFNNPNELIKKISKKQLNDNNQDNILDEIYNKLALPDPQDVTYLNKPNSIYNDIQYNQNLINKFLSINYMLLRSIPVGNINRILKVITNPFPKYYLPSLHLYDNNLLKIPVKKVKTNRNNQYNMEKSYIEIK